MSPSEKQESWSIRTGRGCLHVTLSSPLTGWENASACERLTATGTEDLADASGSEAACRGRDGRCVAGGPAGLLVDGCGSLRFAAAGDVDLLCVRALSGTLTISVSWTAGLAGSPLPPTLGCRAGSGAFRLPFVAVLGQSGQALPTTR